MENEERPRLTPIDGGAISHADEEAAWQQEFERACAAGHGVNMARYIAFSAVQATKRRAAPPRGPDEIDVDVDAFQFNFG